MTPTLTKTMTSAASYKKLTQREHILQLPDTYIGSRDNHREFRWVYDSTEGADGRGQMVWREVSMNPGLFKIFDELLVNAMDHVIRQSTAKEKERRVTRIVVTITPTLFNIYNDGEGIPVSVHPEYKVMVPELIFGHLLTSSNYDEKEEKVVGGKNGYGAKLTNIYSTHFIVRTCDTKLRYEQHFRNNMSVVEKPILKKAGTAGKKSFTEVYSVPDLERFFGPGAKEIPADMLDVLRTRVVDIAALSAGKGVSVFLSDNLTTDAKKIPVSSFEQYAHLFVGDSPVFYEKVGERWEIAAVLSRSLHSDSLPEDRHISFVNGIYTRRGGKHVDAVTRSVLHTFCEGPGKKLDLKPAQLKDAVTFFVNATIVNPSFDSQAKETLTTPATKFGSVFKCSDTFVAKLAKEGGLLEEAQAILDARLSREAKKTDGRKSSTLRGIPKLEDATWAGTSKSAECTLILTEGDSAASTAISGLKVVGRERFGVFPLKGKILNVKDAPLEKKTKNEELTRIKRILGLEHGRKYKDVSQLRYGKVMIMTDQDVDGSHIKGLLINLFHTEWPELLRLHFLSCLMTPLLKVSKGATTHCFFTSSDYEKWLETQGDTGSKGWKVKYYKGLGTSTAVEAREYFTNMNTVRFQWDDSAHTNIDLAFNKKRADDRKVWLSTYDRRRTLEVPAGGADVSYTRFINDELIHFSIEDNIRSLPHLMDGLKPSQRKILWAARKRNLVSEIKVAQLAGYVSETAAYHHGEVSLTGAIVGMAQNFVGSNNINVLSPNGQFGTRLQGGDDSASPRYIFTALEPIVSALFSKSDDPALLWVEEDGQQIEPEFYTPVIPLLLANGASGIGTGFSSDICPYSPTDLVRSLRNRLTGVVTDLTGESLLPWWDGFRGTVTQHGTSVKTRGIYQFLDDDTQRVRITELPVGVWTKTYKFFLENMISGEEKGSIRPGAESSSAGRYLKSFQEAYNDVDVDFTLQLDTEYYHEARAFPAEFEKKFHLVNSMSLTNMVAFDAEGKLRRFSSMGDIFESFYVIRLQGYVARKANELARMTAEINELSAKARFVLAVVKGTLRVANAEDTELLLSLKAHDLPPLSAPEHPDDLKAFEYLLRMRVDRLKASSVAELEKELQTLRAQHAILQVKTPEQLWLEDLLLFEQAYASFVKIRDAGKENQTGVVNKLVPKKRKVIAKKK